MFIVQMPLLLLRSSDDASSKFLVQFQLVQFIRIPEFYLLRWTSFDLQTNSDSFLLPLVCCLLIFSSSAVRVGGVVPSFTPTTDQWSARPSWMDRCICICKSKGLNLRFVLVVWCWVKYVQCVKCHFFLCYSNLNWFILDVQMRCNTSFGIKHLLGYATPSVTLWLPSFVRACVYRASQKLSLPNIVLCSIV